MDNIIHGMETAAAVMIFVSAVLMWRFCGDEIIKANRALVYSIANERIQYSEDRR